MEAKILVLGQRQSGKTAFLNKLQGFYDEKYKPTNYPYTISHQLNNNKLIFTETQNINECDFAIIMLKSNNFDYYTWKSLLHPNIPFMVIIDQQSTLFDFFAVNLKTGEGFQKALDNLTNEINKLDLPTETLNDGTKRWLKDGKLHRDGDQPAVIDADGTQYWYKEGKCHRDGDQPAIILSDGSQYWYKEGNKHRDGDQPAIIVTNGYQAWYKEGQRHRDGDQPAIIWGDGLQEWFKDGIEYKPDLPADTKIKLKENQSPTHKINIKLDDGTEITFNFNKNQKYEITFI